MMPLRLLQMIDHEDESMIIQQMLERGPIETTLLQKASEPQDFFNILADLSLRLTAEGVILDYLAGHVPSLCLPADNILGRRMQEILPPDVRPQFTQALHQAVETKSMVNVKYTLSRPGMERHYGALLLPVPDDQIILLGRDITNLVQAELRNKQQLETIRALYTGTQKLTESLDPQRLAEDVVRTCVKIFGAGLAWLGATEPDGRVHILTSFPPENEHPRRIHVRWDDSPEGRGPTGQAIRSGCPVIIADLAGDKNPSSWIIDAQNSGFCCSAAFPLISRGKPFGGLMLYSDQPGFFTLERVEFFQSHANQAAAALENARLFTQTSSRLEHLQALRQIDIAITANTDLRLSLPIVLKEVINQLRVDAADILLLNQLTRSLEYAGGFGFHSKGIEHSHLYLGEGHAGRAALERRIINISNLSEEKETFGRASLLVGENFVCYYAAPLIAKDQVVGVLEVFNRVNLNPDEEWLNFLEALAGQAAIAVDNATLFSDLQRSNKELTLAYDATIEGWSHALDLRDKETEGHTLRVTEMALELMHAIGISDAKLVHVRRGALLHDIGKMGVPDGILSKPGPLTDEEWGIMRKHPQHAHDMLSSIAYLRPALDIPYCHHEKWDGSGYPRGLKGERIPLAARIFAVVDVYDALTSDRPYRKAWSKEKALKYVRSGAGIHFDPQAVKAFLIMQEGKVGHPQTANALAG